eukprot:13975-Heterococcus_DN1.PRE.3
MCVCAYITEWISKVLCAATEVSTRIARPRTLASAAAENSVDSTSTVYSSSASTSGSSAAGTTVSSGGTSSGSLHTLAWTQAALSFTYSNKAVGTARQ